MLNGIKHGGAISPILFCIYIDDLFVRLANAGVGCFIGLSYVEALACVDDIALIWPRLHLQCASYFQFAMYMLQSIIFLLMLENPNV